MKFNLQLSLSFVSLLIIFNSCDSLSSKQDFVGVKETHFVVGNQPYYFMGTNFWYGAYLGADADYGNRQRLIRELINYTILGLIT